jgi:hypothetical protein
VLWHRKEHPISPDQQGSDCRELRRSQTGAWYTLRFGIRQTIEDRRSESYWCSEVAVEYAQWEHLTGARVAGSEWICLVGVEERWQRVVCFQTRVEIGGELVDSEVEEQ